MEGDFDTKVPQGAVNIVEGFGFAVDQRRYRCSENGCPMQLVGN